jgi:hypothetical protein
LLRTKDWAYIRYANGAQELYDMRHDPRQFTNLIDDGSHAAKAEELKTLLAEKLKEIDAGKLPAK